MKSLRRGLLDYEYFHLLREKGGDADALVARVMRSALNEKPWEPFWRHPLFSEHGDWSHVPHEWDSVRHQIARRILARTSS
jgi:hypothetical protein